MRPRPAQDGMLPADSHARDVDSVVQLTGAELSLQVLGLLGCLPACQPLPAFQPALLHAPACTCLLLAWLSADVVCLHMHVYAMLCFYACRC